MQRVMRNTQTAVKSFSGFIVLFGVVYLLLVSDVITDEAIQIASFDPIPIIRYQPAPDDTCRALFTISQAMDQLSLHNRTYSEGGELEWRSSAVATTLQELLQKRASPFGAPSSYYYSLAEYLPKLVSFRDDKLGEEDRKVQTKDYGGEMQGNLTNLPFLSGRSRIASGGGVLPQVPCFIASYEQPAAFSHCVRRRLKRSPQLWLYFMGDSKIRNVFMELIQRTDSEYKYELSYLNVTESWPTMKENLAKDKVRWTSVEAKTKAEPRLRISFSFKKFNHIDHSKFKEDIPELYQWASGEPHPDLLVVGYTSWMMETMNLYVNKANKFTADVLDLLMEKHSVVLPLLEQISRWSRVLVLPQSRFRPHAKSWFNMRAAFSDAIFDWNEMAFLYLLRHYRESHRSDYAKRGVPHNTQDPGEDDEESKDNGGGRAPHSVPHGNIFLPKEALQHESHSYKTSKLSRMPQNHPRAYEIRQQVTSDFKDADPRLKETTQRTTMPVNNSIPKATKLNMTPEDVASDRARDYTRILEGNPESHGNRKSANVSQGISDQTWRFKDQLTSTGNTAGLWWWDSSLPLNLAGILECNRLYARGLNSHPIYSNAVLRCHDRQHAGSATNGDLVTMLFNLICNSVVGLHHNYCCT